MHGRSTFPSMSLLDLASAAGHSVTEDGAPRVATVVDAALAVPLELPGSAPHLECCANIINGGIEILSTTGQRPASKHLSAALASAAVRLLPVSTYNLCSSVMRSDLLHKPAPCADGSQVPAAQRVTPEITHVSTCS